ncbi:MAG: helix-turn-helix domain-containing protein [Euryarchaeota archaeon]|nr:helix-turn-helix domain-containing protein [Euryarchaeota archaeon]
MTDEDRIENILNILRKIDKSEESVRNYFKQNQVPFSRAQYYTYRRTLQKNGGEGLHDKRKDGNYTKLTERMKDCIVSIVKENRSISSSQLQSKIVDRFGVKISVSSLNNFRASASLTRLPASREQYKRQKSGGGEILTSLAFFTHISELFTRTILDQVNDVCQSTVFEQNKNVENDHSDTRLHGKFTREYNQLKHVRENRFRSIDDKIKDKDFSSMKIFKTSEKAISRYNLALLCLPLVTSNGRSSRVNRAKGNDLSFLCGYNYKDASLDRYIQELKYLKVSDRLITATAKFWMDFWRNESEDETYFVCYYIDGNTKALWSSNRCYKGRVTMLGRVMNCLENVFIHDGKGHPLYFQTFQGHADLGKHALPMLTKLTELLDDPSTHASVKRILVMDGGANGVQTLRAFNGSDEYYITILDDNQIKTRKFKHIREEMRYKYGNANLVECKIELLDSKESGYIYECRAVDVEWDNGRKYVLITNIPPELLDANEITKKYFDRWPMQEKQFRDAKSGVNIHRITGYGKKIENYDKMSEKHDELCERITQLKTELEKPLLEIEVIEEQLTDLYRQERTFRERSKIVDGQRVLSDVDSVELKNYETKINKCLRQQRTIEKEHKDAFKRLKKYLKEEKRIRDKDTVYRIDTELDQIMTCFKMSFINLCSLFLARCMDHEKFELSTLFESIFQLDGDAFITDEEKKIVLEMNPKEQGLMKKLNKGLCILNEMGICDPDGRSIQFDV